MVLYPEPCLPPQRLKSYHVETYQATLDWAPSPYGTPTDYDLEYRDLNSQNWISISNVTPPFILTGLSAHTSYAIKVKSNCAPNILKQLEFDLAVTDIYTSDWANLGMSPNVRFAVLISTDYGET